MTSTDPDRPAVGDIAYSSWGYDQTNIDYYQVVKVSAASVWLRPVAAQRTETGWATGTTEPLPGQFTGPAFRRKLQTGYSRWGVTITSYAGAWPWDGAPQGTAATPNQPW